MRIFDANPFIEGSRLYYHSDIAPYFWDWLAAEHQKGNLASVEAVKRELDDGNQGYLRIWADHLPDSFWIQPDDAAVAAMVELSAWASHPGRPYIQAAKDEFFRAADYFLVAQAKAGGHEVVTFELPSPNSKKRILIPDACIALGVPYTEPFRVYRQLGLRFT